MYDLKWRGSNYIGMNFGSIRGLCLYFAGYGVFHTGGNLLRVEDGNYGNSDFGSCIQGGGRYD